MTDTATTQQTEYTEGPPPVVRQNAMDFIPVAAMFGPEDQEIEYITIPPAVARQNAGTFISSAEFADMFGPPDQEQEEDLVSAADTDLG